MRIAILCSPQLDRFQQEVLAPIMDAPDIEIAGVLIDCRPRPSLKERFVKNLKRGRGGYMLVMLAKRLAARKVPSMPAVGYFSERGVACVETRQPYSSVTLQKTAEMSADVMVMLGGFGIVKEPLLTMAPQGILSYHHGDMRRYRGQPVGFWELYNNEKTMGVTVQRLSAGIDKGTPIAEKTIAIERGDTVASLSQRALDNSVGMMLDALHKIQNPDFEPAVIDRYGSVYTIPNLRQYITLKVKLLFRK